MPALVIVANFLLEPQIPYKNVIWLFSSSQKVEPLEAFQQHSIGTQRLLQQIFIILPFHATRGHCIYKVSLFPKLIDQKWKYWSSVFPYQLPPSFQYVYQNF